MKYKKGKNGEGFKTLSDLEKVIVDKHLFEQIKSQVSNSNKTFEEVLNEGVYRLNREGKKAHKVRHVRCYEGGIKHKTALQIKEHTFKSSKGHEHKHYYYSKNAKSSLIYAYFYEDINKGKRKLTPLSLFELSKANIKSMDELYLERAFNNYEGLPLRAVLYIGQKFFLYENHKEELKELEREDLLKRLYVSAAFEKDGRIHFRHHLTAKTSRKEEKGKFSIQEYFPLLKIGQSNLTMAIEGKDFEVLLDGTIQWKF